MSLVDELARLEEMRARGTLSEDEFQRAKARLIGEQAAEPVPAASALNRLRRSRSDVITAMDGHSWSPSTRYCTRPDDQPSGVRAALVPSSAS